MLLPRHTRRRLSALRAGGQYAGGDAVQPTEQPTPPGSPAETVIAPNPTMPPGLVVEDSRGTYLSIRLMPADLGQWAEQLAVNLFKKLVQSEAFAVDVRHEVAFVDIETTGLSSTPLFLVGMLHVGAQGPHIHQLLARDYADEAATVAVALELLSEAKVLVSFNGRAFDVPFLRDRSRYHRMEWTVQPPQHVDMLWVARRQRDLAVPDHRLVTLESHLCGRRRSGDIPGELIPAAYHRFVDTGATDEMALILQHNQIDLLTTAELAARWQAELLPPPQQQGESP